MLLVFILKLGQKLFVMAGVQYSEAANVTYDISFLARRKLSKVDSEKTIFTLIIHQSFLRGQEHLF